MDKNSASDIMAVPEDLIEKYFSESNYEKMSRNQAKKLGTVSLSPSTSKSFHRDNILFQVFHLNTFKRCYDHWDKNHGPGWPRSSLRNAILDRRLDWDPKKAKRNVEEGKPRFDKIVSAKFFPVRAITCIKESGEVRFIEYLQLDDLKDYRVAYVWRMRKCMKGEYDARIISLHEAGDRRGKEFIESRLLQIPFFVDGTSYAMWAPHAITKSESEHAVIALFEYNQSRSREMLPVQFSIS
ncbi:MAG: hypothetical protein F4047_05665 [Caldilineaceae bacterium SB0670_bin_27]|nr:hypothetical protein [Caldilineaceae bacterium SB0670_bin_27]